MVESLEEKEEDAQAIRIDEDPSAVQQEETKGEVTKKKNKRGVKMSINTTAARSDLALLHALIEMNSWREMHLREAKADVIWQFPQHETESKLLLQSFYNVTSN